MAFLKAHKQVASVTGAAAAAVLLFAGCTTQPTQEQVRQQAASDASQVHHDLKVAGADAKHELEQARTQTKEAIAGARQGWDADSGKSGSIDINHASVLTLETLPGVSGTTARAIVANRPYDSPRQLLSRNVVSSAEYDRLAGLVAAH